VGHRRIAAYRFQQVTPARSVYFRDYRKAIACNKIECPPTSDSLRQRDDRGRFTGISRANLLRLKPRPELCFVITTLPQLELSTRSSRCRTSIQRYRIGGWGGKSKVVRFVAWALRSVEWANQARGEVMLPPVVGGGGGGGGWKHCLLK